MSNIDKHALREEFQCMQKHYSDPADRNRQVIYIAAEALLDELEYYKSREERVTRLVLDNQTSWDELHKKLKAAEKHKAEVDALKAQIAELESFRTAYMEWSAKTDWLQTDKRLDVLKPWGKHRADVLKAYIEYLEPRASTNAAADVLAERQRQITTEGWTPEHDDEHCNNEMAMAAVCYINETGTVNRNGGKPWGWPWDASWWKPNARRRNLVKAGALILAEIERIDRSAGIGKGE